MALLTAACISPSLASVASDPYEGTPLQGQAPDFKLLDQTGARVRLSDFRGKLVVLTFMDSQCQEVCPLTAIHLRKAALELGDQASMVVFLGVNVNVEANGLMDVAETTRKWRLDEIPTWGLTHSTLPGSMNTGWLYAATPTGAYLSMDCF